MPLWQKNHSSDQSIQVPTLWLHYKVTVGEAMGKNQHVTPKDDKWQVKGAGNTKATAITNTQAEAIAIAKAIAMNQESELLIHGTNGRIRQKNSYGNDDYPPKG